ncbi:MAG TPA: fluoride efflux transporter CrcB [Ktedonobacteraceae bacterium]|nr:fluoride efflux transporter CrcB [Ktedonobacteraceae bacterium]
MNLASLGWTGVVGFAGALGALTRYLLGRFIVVRFGSTFPWSTLLINVTGAFLIGLFAGLTTAHMLAPVAQTVLATGFLGGYTTFSTMSWESVQLLRGGSVRQCIFYIGGTAMLGLLAAALGLKLGGAF